LLRQEASLFGVSLCVCAVLDEVQEEGAGKGKGRRKLWSCSFLRDFAYNQRGTAAGSRIVVGSGVKAVKCLSLMSV
jgi:hypothetical protein